MLQQISWSSYWTFALILISIYYLITWIIFYSKINIKIKYPKPLKEVGIEPNKNETAPIIASNPKTTFSIIDDFIEDTNSSLLELCKHSAKKQEIISTLKMVIEKHIEIRKTPFKYQVNNVIKNQALTHCSIHLTEEDLSMLWS